KQSPGAGNVYYENLCMKAVNQSIGRAIRHAKDYATIVLLDKRYSRSNIKQKLPKWIQTQLKTYDKFGPAFSSIVQFFGAKKKLQAEIEQKRFNNRLKK